MKPIEDFYCVPKSEEEAREIIERAVAHGAELFEALPGIGGYLGYDFQWDEYSCWAVRGGKTHTQSVSYYADQGIECLTLDQLRERAPFVSELTEDVRETAMMNHPFEITLNGVKLVRLKDSVDLFVPQDQYTAARRALHFAGMLEKKVKQPFFKSESEKEEFIKDGVESGDFLLVDLPDDEVNSPAHYASGEIECIDAIRASMSKEEFEGYLRGNVQKYLWRFRHKGGKQSLEKAEWYLKRLLESVE